MVGYGAKNAEKESIRFDQTRNIIDVFLKDLKAAGDTDFFLETCNMAAAGTSAEAVMDDPWKYRIPKGPDRKPLFGQDDLMFFFLYSAYGQSHAPNVKLGQNENEYIENIAWVLEECANVKAEVKRFRNTEDTVYGIIGALTIGHSLVLSYRTDYHNSGHYISVVKVSKDANQFMSYDSWSGNKHAPNKGVKDIHDKQFFLDRVRPRFIEVSAK